VEASGYSPRQFERYFKQMVGVSPKRYLRVDRLQHALAIKRAAPEASWAAVAIDAGFHDQMHLIHEFKALGGDPPARLLSVTYSERPWTPN
jgi:transcriptional regulator GlxA family with amidase domain